MKVLVCDPLAERALERLKEAGLQVTVRPGMSPDELAQELSKGHQAVVVRSATKLRKDVLAFAQGVELIVRAGVGLDNIDVDAAQAKGIRVQNTPQASSDSVAELALGHMFALARLIPQATGSMREGRWEK
ncbi:MAG: phosphoglycerate dehydrogenase, partial [Candidatus Bipolaricaulota bacterium]